jgi:tetratricopeptide (TPR) repeat protein
MNELISGAREEWKAGETEKALKILESPELMQNAEAFFLAGEIHYSCQDWGLALNSFRRCLQINPDFAPAKTYVDLILNILNFFHTDQFNP